MMFKRLIGLLTATSLISLFLIAPANANSNNANRNPSNDGKACTVTQSSNSAPNSSSRASTCSPTITSISPNIGTTNSGATVNIFGTNLINVTSVYFGDRFNVPFNKTATSLQVTSPGASNPGTVDVVVNSSSGSFKFPGGYTFYAPPTITSVAPNTGATTGGTTVTITGTNLASVNSVLFGSTAANVISSGQNTATVISPSVASAGQVDISLTTLGGTVTYNNAFTYTVPISPFSLRVQIYDNISGAINLPSAVSFDICEVDNLSNCTVVNSSTIFNSVIQLNLSGNNKTLRVTYHNSDVTNIQRMYLFGIYKYADDTADFVPSCCSSRVDFTYEGQQADSHRTYSNSNPTGWLYIYSNTYIP